MATRMAAFLAVFATSLLMGDAFAQRPESGFASRPGGGPPAGGDLRFGPPAGKE